MEVSGKARDRRPPLTRGVQGRFLFVGERLCLDFVNTRVVVHGELVDLLQDFRDWVEWSLEANVLNPSQARQALRGWKESHQAAGAFEVAKAFRESLRLAVKHIVARDRVPESSITQINALLRHPIWYSVLGYGQDRLEIQRHLALNKPIHLLVPVAESAADLFSQGDLSLIKKCDNPACVLYFYDTTKNHARRWCSMNLCGNQMKVAAFYRRNRKVKGRSNTKTPRHQEQSARLR
jgi:predicted RNA-binding Zn ribbon-like protein